MHDDDVRQLFAYVAAPPSVASSSSQSEEYESSDDENDKSLMWTHNGSSASTDIISPIEEEASSDGNNKSLVRIATLGPVRTSLLLDDDDDDDDEDDDDNDDNEDIDDNVEAAEEVIPTTGGLSEAEVITPVPSVILGKNDTHGVPLSKEELEFARSGLRILSEILIKMGRPKREKKDKLPKFKVPSNHVQFNGDPEQLEPFITHMQLAHSEYTTGPAADKDNPLFINKLVEYFVKESSVRHWFEAYAVKRREKRLKLSWSKLVLALRKDYGIQDLMEEHLTKFHNLTQGKDNIHAYIAKKKTAALLVKDHVTPLVLMYAFMQGLREDFATYVREKGPSTVEEAQAAAITYEGLQRKKHKRAPHENITSSIKRKNVSFAESGGGNNKKLRTKAQQVALDELLELRRGKCFYCGSTAHQKNECNSTSMVKDAHFAKIKQLKARINTSD
jgi:hypothetical protein